MDYRRLPIEIESPEERGYETIANNLTESSVRDLSFGDLDLDLSDLVLAYGDHRGEPGLRELIAADAGPGITADQVLTAPGAAAALFFVATSLLGPGDHAVIQHTNYSTNLETPRLLGAEITPIALRFSDRFEMDIDQVAALVRPGVTKLISITVPHNPTGTMPPLADLHRLVELAESSGAWLLVDETYRGLTHDEPYPSAATLSDRAISVCSLSKSFGLPGIRLGWAVTTDTAMAERLLAAKEQVVICTSVLDEAVAGAALGSAGRLLPPIRTMCTEHRAIVSDWMAEQTLVSWVEPTGGVVCFPRLDDAVDPNRFIAMLNDAGTFVGEGHWFDADARHFRLGYGWPTTDELRAGLADITAAACARL